MKNFWGRELDGKTGSRSGNAKMLHGMRNRNRQKNTKKKKGRGGLCSIDGGGVLNCKALGGQSRTPEGNDVTRERRGQ